MTVYAIQLGQFSEYMIKYIKTKNLIWLRILNKHVDNVFENKGLT